MIMRKERIAQNGNRVDRCRVLLSRMMTQVFLPSCPTCMYCSTSVSSPASAAPVPER